MENVISRVRNTANLIVLMIVVVLQLVGLAIQVKRPSEAGSTRLIRIWAVSGVTPLTRGVVHLQDSFSDTFHNYFWLQNVRKENEDLKNQIAQMRMEQVRMVEDATQARRLQLLLGFKEQYISKTLAAQVISTTGSEFSRGIYIDKGSKDGLKPDMPVVSPDGVVGKVLRVYGTTSLVLLLNDPSSGAGVILEKSRLQGVLKGSPNGATFMSNVMSDEKVEPGERIVTSGGDRVFPKGLPVGTVMAVTPGKDLFLNIRVRPSASINKLEEVLVITHMDERTPDTVASDSPIRAIDILAERLPTVAPPPPKTDAAATGKPGTAASNASTTPKAPTAADLKNKGGSVPKQAEKPAVIKQAQTTPPAKPQGTTKDTPQ